MLYRSVGCAEGAAGKAILEKQLAEQQAMLAQLEGMKESAARQKIMDQLKAVRGRAQNG